MKTLFVIVLGLTTSLVSSQNLNLVSNLNYQGQLIDLWGHVDSLGNEYALVGVHNGVSIVDVSTNPANPVEAFFLSGPSSGWRDIKTWNNYAYVTNEKGGGFQIIDLNNLPYSVSHSWFSNDSGTVYSTAHNLWIDEFGVAYVCGVNAPTRGILMLDLTQDPLNPVEIGYYTNAVVHNAYVRGDTAWICHIGEGEIAVVDVTDHANPVTLTTFATPNNLTHSCWLSDDGTLLYVVDEVPNGFLSVFNVSDLNNPQLLDMIAPGYGTGVIPHDPYLIGDFVVNSWYKDGLFIFDTTYPDNLIEIGNYDTSPQSGTGFRGCWGVYPYLPSGLIVATDMDSGLFVLQPNYVQAAYLEGSVVDSTTGFPLNNSTIEILGTSTTAKTAITGIFKTGYAVGGTYDISISRSGFHTEIVTDVVLTSGVITNLQIELKRKQQYSCTFTVLNGVNAVPIPGASIQLVSDDINQLHFADANGQLTLNNLFEGDYTISSAKWGFKDLEVNNVSINNNLTLTLELQKGWYDSFSFNLGWTRELSGNTKGNWVRGIPSPTNFLSSDLLNPGNDMAGDNDLRCYYTGSTGMFDMVNGTSVTLKSPGFVIWNMNEPWLSAGVWFSNINSQLDDGNDSLTISLVSENDTVRLESYNAQTITMHQWNTVGFDLSSWKNQTDTFHVWFTAIADVDSSELMEAAVDIFSVADSGSRGYSEVVTKPNFVSLFPQPVRSYTELRLAESSEYEVEIRVIDLLGKVRFNTVQPKGREFRIERDNLPSGIYIVEVTDGLKTHVTKMMVGEF